MDAFMSFSYNSSVEFPPSSYDEFYNHSWDGDWLPGAYYNDLPVSQMMKTISIVVYITTMFVGTIGNGLVIFLTGFHMKKTVTTIWYFNLAVADFVFALCLSTEIIHITVGHWMLGRFLCKIDTLVPFLNMFASVFFLTAISADRCVSVVHPVWALNHRTPWLASIVAIIIWVAALALTMPYLIFRDIETTEGITHCVYNFGSEDASGLWIHHSIVVTEFVVGFLIPFHIILACYCVIIIKLRGKIFGRFRRSFKIIIVVVIAFFFCWFPYHLFAILDMLEDDSLKMKNILDIGLPLANGLVCLNSCLNPFLYAFIGLNCRRANCRSFLSAFQEAFNERWAMSSFSTNRNPSSTSGVESSLV